MHVIIETTRLLLREFTPADAGLLFKLNKDPDVTRYTYDPMRDEAHALEVLEQVILPQYALYNHGRWAVHVKPGHRFIGWCGLKYIPQRDEVDLGYRFIKEEWGNGFATEAAAASMKYGFGKLSIPRIVGRVIPDNIGSIKVLKNCGLQYRGEEWVDGYLLKTYEALNPLIHKS